MNDVGVSCCVLWRRTNQGRKMPWFVEMFGRAQRQGDVVQNARKVLQGDDCQQ